MIVPVHIRSPHDEVTTTARHQGLFNFELQRGGALTALIPRR